MHPEGPIEDLQQPGADMSFEQRGVALMLAMAMQQLGDQWDPESISLIHDGTATYATAQHKSDPRLEIGIRLWDEGVVHEEEG